MLDARSPRTTAPGGHHFDAVVIGAGVTGVAAARRMAELEPQSHILLLDATVAGEGAAGRNSGFLINLPHNTGMSGHGSSVQTARKQMALYDSGLTWLKTLIDQHGIDCGWHPVGKYHAAATKDGERSLRATLRQYDEWGVGYEEIDAAQLAQRLGTRYYHYGYHSRNNVFVQPAALIRGLVDSLPENVCLWENAPVLSIEKGTPHRVNLPGRQFSTPRIILANNGFARKLGFARDRVITIHTYAALTPVLDDEALAMLGDADEWGVIPANRLGTTLRKVASRRFMVRSAYSYEREQSLTGACRLLQDSYRRRYPQMRSHDFEYVWSGATALTRNGALYFGALDDGIYLSIGCNGAGMLKGSIFGKLLGEMACGHQSPELSQALGLQRPGWLPPEPLRRVAVLSAIQYQKHKAGRER